MDTKQYKFIPLKCPVCGKMTDSLAGTAKVRILFLWIYARTTSQRIICCPQCRRKILKENIFGWNILSTNITWPIFAVIMILVVLPFTYIRGHSTEVRKMIAKEMNSH